MAQYISQIGYGLTDALPNLAPLPLQAKRDPTIQDKGFLVGTLWVNLVTNTIFVLVSIVNNAANWVEITQQGGAGNFTSLRVDPGNTVLVGALSVFGPVVTNDNITCLGLETVNEITALNGVITANNGDIVAQNINNNAASPRLAMQKFRPPHGATVLADGAGRIEFSPYTGTGQVQEPANIESSVTGFGAFPTLYTKYDLKFRTNGGNLVSTSRMEISSLGVVTINAPDFPATVGLVVDGGVNATALYVSGDPGGNAGAQTAFTNATVPAGGASTGMIVQTSAGAGTTASAGFIKIYVGNQVAYIPYWTQTT